MKLDQLLGQVLQTGKHPESTAGSSNGGNNGYITPTMDAHSFDNMHSVHSLISNANAVTKKRIAKGGSVIEPNNSHPSIGSELFANLSIPWLLQGMLSSTPANPTTVSTAAHQASLLGAGSRPIASIPHSPLNSMCNEDVAKGVLAVGGCRQCARTFTDRLELIHHFVDHFPTIFYSFDPLPNSMSSLSKEASLTAGKKMDAPLMLYNSTNPTSSAVALSLQESSATLLGGDGTGSNLGLLAFLSGRAKSSVANDSIASPSPSTPVVDVSTHSYSRTPPLEATHRARPSTRNLTKAERAASRTKFDALSKRDGMELPYHMCPHCCLTFADDHAYMQHLSTHDSYDEKIDEACCPISPKPVRCMLCDMRFSNVQQLAEHERLHCHRCPECRKTFMTLFDLNLHAGTHTGYTYDCKDCGKCFPCRRSLAEHNKTHRALYEGTTQQQQPQRREISPSQSLASEKSATTNATSSSVGVQSTAINSSLSPSTTSSSEGSDLASKSMMEAGPLLGALFAASNSATRKRHCKRPKKSGEKSRRQTTLVAMELARGESKITESNEE